MNFKAKKCLKCSQYTLEDKCPKCNSETKTAGEKFRERFIKTVSSASQE